MTAQASWLGLICLSPAWVGQLYEKVRPIPVSFKDTGRKLASLCTKGEEVMIHRRARQMDKHWAWDGALGRESGYQVSSRSDLS